jgi:uncharacterized protein YjbI with pentapeptide repeats
LRWTNLSGADLQDAQINNANMHQANLEGAKLDGANLIRANLQGARNLSEKDLEKASCLYGATMPDGSLYDGRFDLPGDLQMARFRNVDIQDADAMADFYGVSVPNHWSNYENMGLTQCTHAQLICKLRSFDNQQVAHVIDEFRRRGRLSDGSLQGLDLRFVHMQGVDLSTADLSKSNLNSADMRAANLAYAHMVSARLHKVNLRGANFEKADLRDADLTESILQDTINLRADQLIQTYKLRGAMLPDGSRYDGRFNLMGDISSAYSFGIDIENPEALASYYGISVEDYLVGQSWVHDHLPVAWARKEHLHIADVLFALAHPPEVFNT